MKEILLANETFAMAANQFDRTADFLGLSKDVKERCKWPKRMLSFSLPVRMDNGEVKMFFGHRVQHHLSRGPVKGGIRYHHSVELGEVAALAMWMNWKCALMRLPYGGGKGGIACDPRSMSLGEKERLTRRFAQELLPFIGEEVDVPAPDVGTDAQTMAWIVDTASTQAGRFTPGVVTGKPIELQGSQGRTKATGHGVAFCATRALSQLGINCQGATAVIQGFGNVGSYAAETLQRDGVKVQGISDVTGAIWNAKGLDIHALRQFVAETGGVMGFPESEAIDPDEMMCREVDILAPCAMERAIGKSLAEKLRCRIIAEGANGPTTPEADRIIEERGDIFLIPDVMCNAGGVTVSYFEWVQNLQRFSWTEQEVITKLETLLASTFDRLMAFAEDKKCGNRVAALALGIKEVSDVKRTRGLYP